MVDPALRFHTSEDVQWNNLVELYTYYMSEQKQGEGKERKRVGTMDEFLSVFNVCMRNVTI